MRSSRCILRLHTHTPGVCNTYWFSTATMVSRTRLSVRLFVHCLSCYVTFMRGIYRVRYVPRRIHACVLQTIAAVVWLLYKAHVLLCPMINVLDLTLEFSELCGQYGWFFFFLSWCRAFPVCCSDIFWKIAPVLSLLFLHSTYAVFVLGLSVFYNFLSFFLDHISISHNCRVS